MAFVSVTEVSPTGVQNPIWLNDAAVLNASAVQNTATPGANAIINLNNGGFIAVTQTLTQLESILV